MSRANIIEVGFISGFIGILSESFIHIQYSFIILLILITIDTVTGISTAIKYQRFNSKGIVKLVKKIISYSTSIATVRLLEIGALSNYNTTLLTQIIIAYLIIVESISILENMTLLGVPLPPNFVSFLLRFIRIPGIEKILEEAEKNLDRSIAEIDEIIIYQIPTIDNLELRKLIEIKFDVWKNIMMQINTNIVEKDNQNSDLLYFKIMSLIETGLKEMNNRWKDTDVSKHYLDLFNKHNQPKLDGLLKKIKNICYADDDLQSKKEQLINSIVIIFYQTIIDARKGISK